MNKKKNNFVLNLLAILIFSMPFSLSQSVVLANLLSYTRKIFGEFNGQLFFYVMIYIYIYFFIKFNFKLLSYKIKFPKPILAFFIFMLISIIFSSALNMHSIFYNMLKGRTGIEKYVVQLGVFIFFLFSIIFTYNVLVYLKEKYGYKFVIDFICRTIHSCMIFATIYCFLELLDIYIFKHNMPIFSYIESILGKDNYNRIKYVTMEASTYGLNFLTVFMPFEIYNFRKKNFKSSFLIIVFTGIFTYFTLSRASLIIFILELTVSYGCFIIKDKSLQKKVIMHFMVLIIIITSIFNYKTIIYNNKIFSIIQSIINYKGTTYEGSNMSRFGMTISAINMGKENLLGVGVGQFGFNAEKYFNEEYSTIETKQWLSNKVNRQLWPLTHNLFALIFAEFGLIGLIGIVYLVFKLIFKTMKEFILCSKDYCEYELCFMYITGFVLIFFSASSFANYPLWFIPSIVIFILYNKPKENMNIEENKYYNS